MRTKQHRMNLPLVFGQIILCCSAIILLNCIGKINFERNINVNGDWNKINDSILWQENTTFKTNLELNYQPDKVYLMQVSIPEEVLQLKVNNKVVLENNRNKTTISYNITNQIEGHNQIEITTRNATNVEAQIHCLNKLYISDVEMDRNTKSAFLEIEIKNAHNTEKQGTLVCILYTAEMEELEKTETLVFIAGNAENFYRKEFDFDGRRRNIEGLKVVCKLYCEGILVDCSNNTIKPHN